MLDQASLQELFQYEPETGAIYHKPRELKWCNSEKHQRYFNNRKAGRRAESKSSRTTNHYLTVHLFGKKVYCHRLIWVYMTGEEPPSMIDHINRDGTDNRWSNLRDGTNVNRLNLSRYRNNKSGAPGVYRASDREKWRAVVRKNGKDFRLGYFSELSDAEKAVSEFYRKNGFSEGHGEPRAA